MHVKPSRAAGSTPCLSSAARMLGDSRLQLRRQLDHSPSFATFTFLRYAFHNVCQKIHCFAAGFTRGSSTNEETTIEILSHPKQRTWRYHSSSLPRPYSVAIISIVFGSTYTGKLASPTGRHGFDRLLHLHGRPFGVFGFNPIRSVDDVISADTDCG